LMGQRSGGSATKQSIYTTWWARDLVVRLQKQRKIIRICFSQRVVTQKWVWVTIATFDQFIFETMQDMAIVTMEDEEELVRNPLNDDIFNDLEWHRIEGHATIRRSQTVQGRHVFTTEY